MKLVFPAAIAVRDDIRHPMCLLLCPSPHPPTEVQFQSCLRVMSFPVVVLIPWLLLNGHVVFRSVSCRRGALDRAPMAWSCFYRCDVRCRVPRDLSCLHIQLSAVIICTSDAPRHRCVAIMLSHTSPIAPLPHFVSYRHQHSKCTCCLWSHSVALPAGDHVGRPHLGCRALPPPLQVPEVLEAA
jgi:hypothetical protein